MEYLGGIKPVDVNHIYHDGPGGSSNSTAVEHPWCECLDGSWWGGYLFPKERYPLGSSKQNHESLGSGL